MKRALVIDEASYGPEHPRVATRLNNLASLLQETNRLAEAEPLMKRALAIDEASYGSEPPRVAIQAKEKFQLTNREQSVLEHLAKGWTNKEIANALQISQKTVSEHIKQIMRKTNSTTRTGVLVHIFNS